LLNMCLPTGLGGPICASQWSALTAVAACLPHNGTMPVPRNAPLHNS